MKTISNFLLILAGFSLPFLYANNTPIKKFVTKSDSTKILQTKLESLDNEIKLVNEITNSTLVLTVYVVLIVWKLIVILLIAL